LYHGGELLHLWHTDNLRDELTRMLLVYAIPWDNLKVPELTKEVQELRSPGEHNAIYVFALP
jgi:hypothetical protein